MLIIKMRDHNGVNSGDIIDDMTPSKAFMLKSLSQTSQHILDRLQRVCKRRAEAKVRLPRLLISDSRTD